MTETLATETRKKHAKIHCDEAIAFKIAACLAVRRFTKGKFLARVIKGGSAGAEIPRLLPH